MDTHIVKISSQVYYGSAIWWCFSSLKITVWRQYCLWLVKYVVREYKLSSKLFIVVRSGQCVWTSTKRVEQLLSIEEKLKTKTFLVEFLHFPSALSRSLPNGEFSTPTTGHLPQSSQVRPQQPNNTSSKRIFTSQWKKKSNEAWKEIFSDTRSQSLRFWKTAEADVVVNEACLCLLFLTFDQFSSCHFAHWLLVTSSLA